MCELAVDTVVRYEALVPSYLDFVRQHRGRRTTDQLENALGRFIQWMTTIGGLTELHQLTPVVLREYLSSLHHFRRATIAVHASALRGWLGYLRLQCLHQHIAIEPSQGVGAEEIMQHAITADACVEHRDARGGRIGQQTLCQ